MEQRILARARTRLEAERVVERLDDALRACEAALDDRAERPVLVGELVAGRQVDACDLEEPDPGVAGVEVVPGGLDEAREQPRAEHRLLARLRLRDAQRLRVRILGDEARRVRLVEPGAEQHVLDDAGAAAAPSRAGRTSSRLAGSVYGTSSSRMRRDLLDEVDLAGHVARAPGGNGHLGASPTSKPSRSRIACCSAGGVSRPDHLVGALRAQSDDRGARAARRGRRRRPSSCAPASSTNSWVASRAAGSARYGSMPFSQRLDALGAQAEPLGGAQDPDRLEVRGLEQELARLLVDLALERAHDPGDRHRPLGIGDHEVASRPACGPCRRASVICSPLRARRTTMRPSRELRPVEGVERAAEREHHVVRHVDDVRDRAHARADQPRLQPRRRGADRGADERAADVARAALEVVDANVDLFVAVARRIGARRRRELATVERRDLARDAVDREQVGPVGRQSRARARPRRAGAPPRSGVPGSGPSARTRMPLWSSPSSSSCSERIIPSRDVAAQLRLARASSRPGARRPEARPQPLRPRRSSTRRRRSAAAPPRRRRRGRAGAGPRSDACRPRRRGRRDSGRRSRSRRGSRDERCAAPSRSRSSGARASSSVGTSNSTYSRSQSSGTRIRTAPGAGGRSARAGGCR